MVLNQNACLCKELIFSNWLMGVSPGLLLSALSFRLYAVFAFSFLPFCLSAFLPSALSFRLKAVFAFLPFCLSAFLPSAFRLSAFLPSAFRLLPFCLHDSFTQ
jgi:hypothetical protein